MSWGSKKSSQGKETREFQETGAKNFNDHTTNAQTLPPRLNMVILTVIEVEFLAIFELMRPLPGQSKILTALIDQSFYVVGRYGQWTAVLLACFRAGAINTINYLNQALSRFQPHLVVNVGIAWGANPHKQRLGDVLVANRIVNIDDVKRHRGRIIERSAVPPIDHRSNVMVHMSRVFRGSSENSFKVHIGLYVGSNMLLNDLEVKRTILERYEEAIGGEMESYGIYEAASFRNVPWMVIKGISDWGDGDKHDEYQKIAAANAAVFLHTMCVKLSPPGHPQSKCKYFILGVIIAVVALLLGYEFQMATIAQEGLIPISAVEKELMVNLRTQIVSSLAFKSDRLGQFNLRVGERSLDSTLFLDDSVTNPETLEIDDMGLVTHKLPVRVEGDLHKLEDIFKGFEHRGRIVSERAIIKTQLQLQVLGIGDIYDGTSPDIDLRIVDVTMEQIHELFDGLGAESQKGKVRDLNQDIRSALDQAFLSKISKQITQAMVWHSIEVKHPGVKLLQITWVSLLFKGIYWIRHLGSLFPGRYQLRSVDFENDGTSLIAHLNLEQHRDYI